MADSCKLHLLASAWSWRGVAIRLQMEYPDTRAREETHGKRRKGRRRSDGEAKREKETESE